MWWPNYTGRFEDIQRITGQSEAWLIPFYLDVFSFLLRLKRVPQPFFDWFQLWIPEFDLLKSCTSVTVTAMQVEQKDCRRDTVHRHRHEQRLEIQIQERLRGWIYCALRVQMSSSRLRSPTIMKSVILCLPRSIMPEDSVPAWWTY